MFLLFALTFVEPSTLSASGGTVNGIVLASNLGGAILAGFLIKEKAGTWDRRRIFVVGMTTGLFCYLINYVLAVASLIPRTFSEFVTMGAFEAGALLGVFIWAAVSKQPREKKIRAS
jgi:uncharacterized membrane protein